MTAPRRRWSFSLRTLFVVATGVTVSAILVGLAVAPQSRREPQEHFTAAGYDVGRMTFVSESASPPWVETAVTVAEERIPLVLSARTDGVAVAGMKWVVFENLRCEMKSGKIVHIEIFTAGQGDLAFRIDQQGYFRGVNAQKFSRAISSSP